MEYLVVFFTMVAIICAFLLLCATLYWIGYGLTLLVKSDKAKELIVAIYLVLLVAACLTIMFYADMNKEESIKNERQLGKR